MKLSKTFSAVILFQLVSFLSAFGQGTNVDWDTILQIERTIPTPYSEVPVFATFYSAQHSPASSQPWPALPRNSGFSAWNLASNVWLLDDLEFNYSSASAQANQSTTVDANTFSPAGNPVTPNFGTNLWISCSNVLSGGPSEGGTWLTVYPALNNTRTGLYYEIFSKTALDNSPWQPFIPFGQGNGGTLYMNYFSSSSFTYSPGSQPLYLWAVGSSNQVALYPYGDDFSVSYPSSPTDTTQNVTCQLYWQYPATYDFQMTGSAVYGLDYTILGMNYTNGIGTLTVPTGAPNPFPITISPTYQTNGTFGIQTLTLTLLPVNCIVFEPGENYETVNIFPNTIPVSVVTNLSPISMLGIGYSPVQDALVMSANYPQGEPYNFIVASNASDGVTIVTNWSDVADVPGTVDCLAIPQISTNNFVEGDIYFGDGAAIDKLSADSTQWTSDWCSLTNSSYVCGLYFDRTGVFSNSLIATTVDGNVFVIGCDTNGNALPVHLTTIPIMTGCIMSGAVTIPNDVTNWGPWAGKILTGDPYLTTIFAIDTNGAVASFLPDNFPDGDSATGVATEWFGLVPTNQNLYIVDAGKSEIDEISSAELAPYAGDLVVDSFSDLPGDSLPAEIFIIKWNATNGDFEIRADPGMGSNFKDFTFAPINLLSQ